MAALVAAGQAWQTGYRLNRAMDRVAKYEREVYHHAADVVRDDWNWEGPRILAAYYLRVLLRIANADTRPAWKPDSPFANVRR